MTTDELTSDAAVGGMYCERASSEFRRRWREDASPDLGQLMVGVPATHHEGVLRTLILLDLELLRSAGHSPTQEQMLDRFRSHPILVSSVWKQLTDTCVTCEDDTQAPMVTANRYGQLTPFGTGGMAELLLARDETLRRETVIKRLRKPFRNDPVYTAQFVVEAEITARLDHPGIVPVYGIGQDGDGQPFYVMRRIHGRPLQELIDAYHAEGGPRNKSRASRQQLCTLLEHLIAACRTVACAHDAGFVHCDLKPAHIMVGQYGATFVVDWGLARKCTRSTDSRATMEPVISPEILAEGACWRGFTPGFVSPEQFLGQGEVEPACDIYSLGAILYQVLTNRPPLAGCDANYARQLLAGHIVPPRTLCSSIPRTLEAVCLKAMNVVPSVRHRTAEDLARDLLDWMRDEEVESVPNGIAQRTRRWARRHRRLCTLAAVSAVSVLITAGVVGAALYRTRWLDSLQRDAERRFAAALDTFEQLSVPFANEERNSLAAFSALAENISHFANECLRGTERGALSAAHLARVRELRASAYMVLKPEKSLLLDDLGAAESAYRHMVAQSAQDEEILWRLACNHLAQGRVCFRYGDQAKSEGLLHEALATFKKLKNLPGTYVTFAQLARREADTHHALGELYLQQGAITGHEREYTRAANHFQQSRSLRERLLAQPDSVTRYEQELLQRDLARSHGFLGDVHLARGDVARAETEYEQSLELRTKLYLRNPSDPEHRFQRARGLSNFAMLERVHQRDRARALERLEEARDIQAGLTEDFHGTAEFRLDLGWTLAQLAEMHLTLAVEAESQGVRNDHLDRANSTALEAILMFDTLDQEDPRTIRGMALAGVLRAEAALDVDPDAARQMAVDAADQLNKLLAETDASQEDYFTLGVAHACLGNKEEALESVSSAICRGSNTADRFRAHVRLGFRTLVEDEQFHGQFVQWIEQAQKRVAPPDGSRS